MTGTSISELKRKQVDVIRSRHQRLAEQARQAGQLQQEWVDVDTGNPHLRVRTKVPSAWVAGTPAAIRPTPRVAALPSVEKDFEKAKAAILAGKAYAYEAIDDKKAGTVQRRLYATKDADLGLIMGQLQGVVLNGVQLAPDVELDACSPDDAMVVGGEVRPRLEVSCGKCPFALQAASGNGCPGNKPVPSVTQPNPVIAFPKEAVRVPAQWFRRVWANPRRRYEDVFEGATDVLERALQLKEEATRLRIQRDIRREVCRGCIHYKSGKHGCSGARYRGENTAEGKATAIAELRSECRMTKEQLLATAGQAIRREYGSRLAFLAHLDLPGVTVRYQRKRCRVAAPVGPGKYAVTLDYHPWKQLGVMTRQEILQQLGHKPRTPRLNQETLVMAWMMSKGLENNHGHKVNVTGHQNYLLGISAHESGVTLDSAVGYRKYRTSWAGDRYGIPVERATSNVGFLSPRKLKGWCK